MKRGNCYLVGLLLCLLTVLTVASIGSSRFRPARAQSAQYEVVRLPGARPLERGNQLSAQISWGQPPSSLDIAPGPEAVERACDPSTTAPPVFWDTPPQFGSVITLPSGQQITEPGPDDTVRVIIQLEGDPVAVCRRHLRASAAQLLQPEQDRIRAYDAALREKHQQLVQHIQAQGIALQVRREYTYIFNGLAASIQMADMERIAAMPGVRSVHPDYQVCASLDHSVPLIGADQVWTMLDPYGQPVTGQGMRVAVIDTGIDYTHPDLGGCFGPSCRVIGGYDFVNEDGDPMDDRGHGTHCAGIMAANGTVKGVAPDASLIAYKVLDEEGYGWSSDVIAGVERATDPDGDPGTDDAVDVMSMSLGGAGNPDGPKALAVDAAVDQGVVVAVAAGNTWIPGYETVDSPAVARKALAVGASNNTDTMASFSSRGPVPGFYELIKPDIVAPGVSINSTYLAGEYRSLDGTSMSTPHIAGCAALIRQLHPSWSPQMIQANLMNTAKNLGEDVFTQGAGRVQVDDAADAQAVLAPGSVGFGLVDAAQPLWTKSVTLRLHNVSTGTLDYSLTISGTLPAGVTTHLEPASVALGAGQSVTVAFTIAVDNGITPYESQEPGCYEGRVIAQPGSQGQAQAEPQPKPLVVPFALFKPAVRAPELLAPHWDLRTEDHDITFNWEVVPSATHYRIQIDTSSAFTSPNLISDTVTSNTYTANVGRGTWYWHVLAIDAMGGESAHSEVWRLTIAEPVVQVTTDPGDDRDPAITQAADGTLWVVWTSDRSGTDDLWYKTSSDRGATWSTASQLTTHPGHDRDPAITQSADGTLWVAWASDRSGNDDLWYKTSSDSGATWSIAIQLTTDEGGDSDPAFTRASDGILWVVWASDRSGNDDIWYTTSSDNGLTWSVENQLTTDAGSDHHPAISQAGGSTLWVVWTCTREGEEYPLGGDNIWYTTSSDGGVTWSDETDLTSYGYAGCPAIVEGADSTLWLWWCQYSGYWAGSELRYKTSHDNGATWSSGPSWTWFRGHNRDPDLAVLNDGSVAVGWDSDRSVHFDVWFGIFGQHAEINPPPCVLHPSHAPAHPGSNEFVTVSAYADDWHGLGDVSLIWTRNGTPQSSLEMHDDGDHYDGRAGDRWWGMWFGPFPAGTQITYQVRAVDPDDNATTAPMTPGSFTVTEPPTTVNLQQGVDGYTGCSDTRISAEAPDSNFGSSDLKAGVRQCIATLIRFDLSSIPSKAIIDRAVLYLKAYSREGTEPFYMGPYAVNRSWSEDQASWNAATSSEPWGIPGCNSALTDRAEGPTAIAWILSHNPWYAWWVSRDVQAMVGQPATNNGWLLRQTTEVPGVLSMYSSELGDPRYRPKLVIKYRVPMGPTPTHTPTPSHTPTPTPTTTQTATPTPTNTSTATTTPEPNHPPTNASVAPSMGSAPIGATTYFTTTWTDLDGWQDLKHCYFHIGASPSTSYNVTLLYNVKRDELWLRSDGGTAWFGGFAPGSGGTLENSQAKVDCALTTVLRDGDTLQVTWAIEFKPGYTGAKKTGLKCKDLQKAAAKGEWIGTCLIH